MKPINDLKFWRERIRKAREEFHSVYVCPKDVWEESQNKHRAILQSVIHSSTSVLDAGCGYGRLLELMPEGWHGDYLGIDQSPDFIRMARIKYPNREFIVGRIDGCESLIHRKYDVVVAISVKGMVIANCGQEAWDAMEWSLRQVANELCLLEY